LLERRPPNPAYSTVFAGATGNVLLSNRIVGYTYCYIMRAFHDLHTSDWSSEVCIALVPATPTPTPAVPHGLEGGNVRGFTLIPAGVVVGAQAVEPAAGQALHLPLVARPYVVLFLPPS
jgi:hypothetical protein